MLSLLVITLGLLFNPTAKLPPQIVDAVIKDACPAQANCSDAQIVEYRKTIKSERHDLNGDRVPEIFAYIEHRDFCGIGFNCNFWVFQRTNRRYKILLKDYPVIRIGMTATKGYKDLNSQGRMGACVLANRKTGRHIYLTVFKWDGKEYRAKDEGHRCLSR
jgi:hypothetical protein